jgi:transposase InsO family protein
LRTDLHRVPYYYRQNLDILLDSLLRAWAVHGASRERFLDNAKVYHAHALQAACYALGIRLIHRTAGDPPPGGLIERFFETAQSQFEAEVYAGEILTLQRLNRGLSAWLEEPKTIPVIVFHLQQLAQTRRR